LNSIIKELNISYHRITDLKIVNEKLWNIEDNIRIKELNKEFDADFIDLARPVYVTNDLRFEIKNNISKEYNSGILEVKSYSKY
jgi:ribosomal protein S13